MNDQSTARMGSDGNRRAEILDAALEEFARKGYQGATIKSIAAAARISSPALLYFYFRDKDALLEAVLDRHLPVLRAIHHPADLYERPPAEVLTLLGRAYLAMGHNPVARRLMRVIAGEALRRPDAADAFVRRGPLRVLRFLGEYLDRQVERGRIRPHDTRMSARAFIGMLIPQLVAAVAAPALAEDAPDDDAHLEACVRIFLRGLAPDPVASGAAHADRGADGEVV